MPTGIRLPTIVPPPDRAGGQQDTYEETRTTVEMESGSPRVRNKMRTAPRLMSVRWTMKQDVYHTFDIWFQETIRGGAEVFDLQLLDDTDTLVWYTAEWQDGTYSAEINQDGIWVVNGTLRMVGESFADRPPGTDELAGRAILSVRSAGNMLIKKVLFGRAIVGLGDASVRPALLPLYGKSFARVVAKGRMRARPFYGRSILSVVAQTQFATFGDAELILQFDAIGYTPPDGDVVVLQFDATVYYPPHIV